MSIKITFECESEDEVSDMVLAYELFCSTRRNNYYPSYHLKNGLLNFLGYLRDTVVSHFEEDDGYVVWKSKGNNSVVEFDYETYVAIMKTVK